MRTNDLMHDPQSESAAPRGGRRFGDLQPQIADGRVVHADAVVGHGQADELRAAAIGCNHAGYTDLDDAVRPAHRSRRVKHQIQQHALHGDRVGLHQRGVRIDRDTQQRRVRNGRAHQRQSVSHHVAER